MDKKRIREYLGIERLPSKIKVIPCSCQHPEVHGHMGYTDWRRGLHKPRWMRSTLYVSVGELWGEERIMNFDLNSDARDLLLTYAKTCDHSILPILADALQESGYTGDALLKHLRSPNQHAENVFCHALLALIERAQST